MAYIFQENWIEYNTDMYMGNVLVPAKDLLEIRLKLLEAYQYSQKGADKLVDKILEDLLGHSRKITRRSGEDRRKK